LLMSELSKRWREMGFPEEEISAFESLSRRSFIPEELSFLADEDVALPIMRGKTISQPSTMLIMTSALEIEPDDKVLEIGTGSGYQAAILAKLASEVITTDVIPELVVRAREKLSSAGIQNVKVIEMDGTMGLPDEAPFDKIMITAAAKDFPRELVEQLRPGGIIIAPLGDKDTQVMVRGMKHGTIFEIELLGDFMFTPLYGKYGFEI